MITNNDSNGIAIIRYVASLMPCCQMSPVRLRLLRFSLSYVAAAIDFDGCHCDAIVTLFR